MNLCFSLFLLGVTAASQDVVELTGETWNSTIVDSGDVYFVQFYTPGCNLCKKIEPVWKALGTARNRDPDPKRKIQIARLDCGEHRSVCERYMIQEFPTTRIMYRGTEIQYDVKEEPTLEDIQTYIDETLPLCTPLDFEHCTMEQLQFIVTLETMTDSGLKAYLSELHDKLHATQKKHMELMAFLEQQYLESNNRTTLATHRFMRDKAMIELETYKRSMAQSKEEL